MLYAYTHEEVYNYYTKTKVLRLINNMLHTAKALLAMVTACSPSPQGEMMQNNSTKRSLSIHHSSFSHEFLEVSKAHGFFLPQKVACR